MASDYEYSRLVSRSLDCLGSSQDMVKYRVYMWNEQNTYNNQPRTDSHLIYSGSKGEGLTAPFESDIDVMMVRNNVVCADNIQPFTNMRHLTVFQTDTRETSPGYTRLKLVHNTGRINGIQASLFQSESGDLYLSGDFFVKYVKQIHTENISRANRDVHVDDSNGPSSPGSSDSGAYDWVESFMCISPDLLQSWLTRPRQYGWPTPQLLHDISCMEAHVVPVGFKGSDNYYREWRICFTRAELHLIHSLNDTQTKLYILLKMVAKSIIKPVCGDITSYVMKNIVLWMSEYNPQEDFREELLTQRLIQSLTSLKLCVEANYLANYMIPERNMLAGRLDFTQRQQLVDLLSNLIHEGGSLLLRCERLRETMMMMYMSPEVTMECGRRRDMVERLWLLRECRRAVIRGSGMSLEELDQLCREDNVVCEAERALVELLVPDRIVLMLQGIDINTICNNRLKVILS